MSASATPGKIPAKRRRQIAAQQILPIVPRARGKAERNIKESGWETAPPPQKKTAQPLKVENVFLAHGLGTPSFARDRNQHRPAEPAKRGLRALLQDDARTKHTTAHKLPFTLYSSEPGRVKGIVTYFPQSGGSCDMGSLAGSIQSVEWTDTDKHGRTRMEC